MTLFLVVSEIRGGVFKVYAKKKEKDSSKNYGSPSGGLIRMFLIIGPVAVNIQMTSQKLFDNGIRVSVPTSLFTSLRC